MNRCIYTHLPTYIHINYIYTHIIYIHACMHSFMSHTNFPPHWATYMHVHSLGYVMYVDVCMYVYTNMHIWIRTHPHSTYTRYKPTKYKHTLHKYMYTCIQHMHTFVLGYMHT